MTNLNPFWQTALKWGGINAGIRFTIDVLAMFLPTFQILGIIHFFLIPYFLYRAYSEFETRSEEYIRADRAWGMAAVFIACAFFTSLIAVFGSAFVQSSNVAIENIFYSLILSFFVYAIHVTIVANCWLFKKANQPTWGAVVPIYNAICYTEIAKKPGYWVLLLFIPIVNIIFGIVLLNAVVKAFDKDSDFTWGLVLLPFIFYPILAFNDNKWIYGEDKALKDSRINIEDHLITTD